METATKNRKILVDPKTFKRHHSPIIVFGVDLSLAKGIAWALAVNERIVKTGIEENLSRVFKHVPEDASLVIAEKMFVKANRQVALNLERTAGMLQMLCDENDIPFRQVLGTVWQRPIKRAFGLNGRPFGMKESEWEHYRYRKFRLYLYGFLRNGLKIDDLSNDEIAAGCLALHGSRELKRARLSG